MFDQDTLTNRLNRVPHFRNLDTMSLRDIVAAGQVRRIPQGEVIFCEGERCSGLFVLFRGQVHLCKTSPDGQETIVAVVNPTIMFNEVAVLDGGTNPLTAIANRACIVWQVTHERFQVLMQRYPSVGLGLLPVLASRNRLLLERCEDLSFRTVKGRTAKLLLDLSENGVKPIDRREHSNQVLAARAATVAEPISRTIRYLRQSGAIACTRAWINVQDPGRLAELAEIGDKPFCQS